MLLPGQCLRVFCDNHVEGELRHFQLLRQLIDSCRSFRSISINSISSSFPDKAKEDNWPDGVQQCRLGCVADDGRARLSSRVSCCAALLLFRFRQPCDKRLISIPIVLRIVQSFTHKRLRRNRWRTL